MQQREPTLIDVPEVLRTERLFIRTVLPGDGLATNEAALASWDELHRWMPWAAERPRVEESEAYARSARAAFIRRTELQMRIFLQDEKTMVGAYSVHPKDWSVPLFEIGYWLRSSFVGRGYMTEAVTALTSMTFASLHAARVEIRCSHLNVRSQRVAERCGFVLEARLRHQARDPHGELRDTMVYVRFPDG